MRGWTFAWKKFQIMWATWTKRNILKFGSLQRRNFIHSFCVNYATSTGKTVPLNLQRERRSSFTTLPYWSQVLSLARKILIFGPCYAYPSFRSKIQTAYIDAKLVSPCRSLQVTTILHLLQSTVKKPAVRRTASSGS